MLFHIFVDNFGGDKSSIRRDLVNFMADNMHDVSRRGKSVFQVNGRTFGEYIDALETDEVRADEVAIFFLAIMHSIHVKIILKRGYWATSDQCREEDFAIVLVYVGDNVFRDTTEGAAMHNSSRPVRSPKPYIRKSSQFATLLGRKYRKDHIVKQDSPDAVTLQENKRGMLQSTSYAIQKKRKAIGVVQRYCHLCRE